MGHSSYSIDKIAAIFMQGSLYSHLDAGVPPAPSILDTVSKGYLHDGYVCAQCSWFSGFFEKS